MLNTKSHQSQQSGFTLIEVLVSVVILAIGLLGLAGLQTTGLRATGSAYMVTQATMLANDMADKMRANIPGVGIGGNGSYDNLTVSGTKCTSTPCTCYGATNGCGTAADSAAADRLLWADALAVLPLGRGTVVRGVGDTFTISVFWDDDRSGAIDTSAGSQERHSIQVSL